MPNGGSDNCGTCWFNRPNEGKAGYNEKPEKVFIDSYCMIREMKIDNPYYTYCANHPHHNPKRIEFPVGPVYIMGEKGREVWMKSPENPKIIKKLLEALSDIDEASGRRYPYGLGIHEAMMLQVAEYDEAIVLPELKRILAFDIRDEEDGNFGSPRKRIVFIAMDVLCDMAGEDALDDLEQFLERNIIKAKNGDRFDKSTKSHMLYCLEKLGSAADQLRFKVKNTKEA